MSTRSNIFLRTRITDIDIITHGHVFLYSVVVPDTYRVMQKYTVWPCDVLNQRWCWQTAEHLVSKWSPWPPSSATISAWNKLFLIWTGIMYSQSSEGPFAPCSRDKNKYGNQGRCDTRALPGKCQQVSGGKARRSQICYLARTRIVDSW